MKKVISLSFISAFAVMLLNSCEDKITKTYTANVPIYKSWEDFRSTKVALEAPRAIEEAGRIYIYKQYLLLNDRNTGIHVFDNSNPSNPVGIGFLPIEGNLNMAIRNDVLFTDAYTDLLAIDISDIKNPALTCRTNDVFNYQPLLNMDGYNSSFPADLYNAENGIVVGWKQEKVTRPDYGFTYYSRSNSQGFVADGAAFGQNNAQPSSVGVGGSMAQFTIAGDHLYTLERFSLTAYDLSAGCLQLEGEQSMNRDCETIFPANDHLFIGTTTGMLIYSVKQPGQPVFTSEYPHVNSCDPVVVQNDRAYVTLRTGTTCAGSVNELAVVDISDYNSPQGLATYQLTNPHGLGIDGNTLFVCDGSDGLKVYDAKDDLKIDQNQIAHFQNISTYDVIPFSNILIATAKEGIYQYDYSDPTQIVELSFIPTK